MARMTSERIAADGDQYPLGIDLFGTSAVNPLPSTASAGARQQEAEYQAALARVRAETDLCSSTMAPNWLADQAAAVCTDLREALEAAEAALSLAQAPLTVELRFTGLDKSTAFIQQPRKDCKIAVAKGQIKSDKYFYFHLLHVASSL